MICLLTILYLLILLSHKNISLTHWRYFTFLKRLYSAGAGVIVQKSRALALHAANLSFIPAIPYGPLSPTRRDP